MSGATKRVRLKQEAKQARKEKNYEANMSIYQRGFPSSLPSLIRDQPSDPERVGRIKAQAEARRQRRRGR